MQQKTLHFFSSSLVKNASSPCGTSVIDDSINPHRMELSAISSLQNITKFLSHQHILITPRLITSAALQSLCCCTSLILRSNFLSVPWNISFCFPGYRKREENRALLLSKVMNAPQSSWKPSGEDGIKPGGHFQVQQLRIQSQMSCRMDAESPYRAQILSNADDNCNVLIFTPAAASQRNILGCSICCLHNPIQKKPWTDTKYPSLPPHQPQRLFEAGVMRTFSS